MKFRVRVTHNNSDPLGGDIGPDHSFWTMVKHVSGITRDEMEVGKAGLYQATTADGRMVVPNNKGGHKTEWIQYIVSRVE